MNAGEQQQAAAKYQLGQRIGGGGMAEVFAAQLLGVEGFKRPVAIKRVLSGFSGDPHFSDMFIEEARIVSQLSHPNIVSVLDFDRDADGHLFLVMELVAGKDLRELRRRSKVPTHLSVYVIAEVLRGLGYAHHQKLGEDSLCIVHRDISPHNVLLSWDGAVKISDFGIAKVILAAEEAQSRQIKGKAAYLSPEQARGEALDGRSDLFAAGIVLHELLTGQRLFGVEHGAPDAVIVHRVLSMQIPSVRTLNPSISDKLEAVCLRLLARDRATRYATATDALEALLKCPEYSARAQLELASFLRVAFKDDAPSTPAPFELVHDTTRPLFLQGSGLNSNHAQPAPGFSSALRALGFTGTPQLKTPAPTESATAKEITRTPLSLIRAKRRTLLVSAAIGATSALLIVEPWSVRSEPPRNRVPPQPVTTTASALQPAAPPRTNTQQATTEATTTPEVVSPQTTVVTKKATAPEQEIRQADTAPAKTSLRIPRKKSRKRPYNTAPKKRDGRDQQPIGDDVLVPSF